MRKLRNIFAIIALLSVASCAVDNIDAPSYGVNNSDIVTVMGRMTRFDDKDVTTRGIKDQDEAKLTSMAMAIFKVNEEETGLEEGGCVYYQYADDQAELLFTIERGSNYAYNTRYVIYVFCNMPGMSDTDEDGNIIFGVGNTLDDMLAKYYEAKNIDIPTNGFPMIGSLGDTFSTTFDRDNKVFVLSPLDDKGNLTTPKVDNKTQTLLTIPMKAMYAKVNFTIEVRPDQTIEGNYSPQFTMDGYTVNNVPSKVDFNNSTNSDTDVLEGSFSRVITGTTVASGANKINFTFYLPERYLEPTTKSSAYNYPFKKDGKIRGEDSVYMQRFKSKLVDDSKKATNIVISGRYRDHQNHYWDVDYTIYLGEDNYGDFNIKRNSEYNNIVTIRGIQSSSDMSDKEGAISIDHRVNVTRTQPAIISLRREVLLDSHFEVRPLRVRKSEIGDVEGINAVKVEVVNPGSANDKSGTWWMRLERSFGDGTPEESPTTTVNGATTSIYIDSDASSASYGKRKFFTFDLVTGGGGTNGDVAPLNNSTSVILPLTDATECCWIYVDECTETGDEVRAGIVKVSYGKLENGTFKAANNATYPDVNYVINQRKLFEVKYDDPSTTADEDRKYHIEYEEEYLHNFDADDDYGQTEFDGMQWGLPGIMLSYDNKALYFGNKSQSWLTSIFNAIVNYVASSTGINPMYDFYIPKHDTSVSTLATKRDFRGYVFCSEIIQTINGQGNHDNDESNNIDILQLDEQPDSAIEYCYNKNKRNRNGQVAWTGNTDNLNWYLPAVDEIEDIVMSKYGESYALNTYARFIEFQSQFYWSSQPSYVKNFARYEITGQDGEFYFDDNTHARATSVWYDISKQKFDYSRSGTAGYYAALRIFAGDGWFGALAPEYEILYDGTYQNHTLGTISREPGNQPRTEKNRIRCVRKSQYTNTSAN